MPFKFGIQLVNKNSEHSLQITLKEQMVVYVYLILEIHNLWINANITLKRQFLREYRMNASLYWETNPISPNKISSWDKSLQKSLEPNTDQFQLKKGKT